MEESERLVEQYLKNLGYEDVLYEPDGKKTPDFLVDGRIAIEVRRLNQNFDDGTANGTRGLEETSIPLKQNFCKYLSTYGRGPISDYGWFVGYSFSRPIPKWSEIKRELDVLLRPLMESPEREPFEKISVVDGTVEILLVKASEPKSQFFSLGSYNDKQDDGWRLSAIYENLRYCIAKKTRKPEHREKYQEWWLILPDHIGYRLTELDPRRFYDEFGGEAGGFDKILLLDPLDATHAFQVHPRPGPPLTLAQSDSM